MFLCVSVRVLQVLVVVVSGVGLGQNERAREAVRRSLEWPW